MNDKEQAYRMLRDFVNAKHYAPWTAAWFERLAKESDSWMGPRRCLERLGGMAGEW